MFPRVGRVEVSDLADPPFRVTDRSSATSTVLELTGELDVASAAVLENCVYERRPLTAKLTMDVSGLAFVDSSGRRALTTARHAAVDDVGEPVTLVGCTDMLRKPLRITGLSTAFVGADD
jgi:anti-anti-sigma factor